MFGAKSGGLGFPNPDWTAATNALVMAANSSNAQDDLTKPL